MGFPAYPQNTACSTRTVVVSAASRSREFHSIWGLKTGNFLVVVDGKPVTVPSVKDRSQSATVIFLLDVGKSQNKAKWMASLRILESLFSEIPEAEVSLLTFDDKVEESVSLGNRRSRAEALAKLSPSKQKESGEGLIAAVQTSLNVPGGVQAADTLLIITASELDFDRNKRKLLEDQLTSSGTRIFGISLDASHLPAPLPGGISVTVQSYSTIESVVRSSGGLWTRVVPGDPDGERTATKSIAGLISNSVAVELGPGRIPTGRKEQKLEVMLFDDSGNPVKDVMLFYPPNLPACH